MIERCGIPVKTLGIMIVRIFDVWQIVSTSVTHFARGGRRFSRIAPCPGRNLPDGKVAQQKAWKAGGVE